jgi:hypothetical protein
MEAEKWAHEKMRENGVPVPRSKTKRGKAYVAHKINRRNVGVQNGLTLRSSVLHLVPTESEDH